MNYISTKQKTHAVDGCRINYRSEDFDNTISMTTGFHYRFLDKDDVAFPILISTHAFGVIVKQIKAMIYHKENVRQVDKHVRIGENSIKIEKIVYMGANNPTNNDKDYVVTLFNESLGKSVDYPLCNKIRVSHPNRKEYGREMRIKYGRTKSNRKSVRVNMTSRFKTASENNANLFEENVNSFDAIKNSIDAEIEKISNEIKELESVQEKIKNLNERLSILQKAKEQFNN